jgi:hypothetical protein
VAGVVLERSPVEERYFLWEYLLADPGARDSTGRLFGVRPNGVVAHVGEVQLDDEPSFELRALDTRYSPPVTIEGAYDLGKQRLELAQMLIHPDFERTQTQPASPTPIEFPV